MLLRAVMTPPWTDRQRKSYQAEHHIISPNGGEKIKTGSNFKIRWYTTNVPATKPPPFSLIEVLADRKTICPWNSRGAKQGIIRKLLCRRVLTATPLSEKTFFWRRASGTLQQKMCSGGLKSNNTFTIVSGVAGGPPATELGRGW